MVAEHCCKRSHVFWLLILTALLGVGEGVDFPAIVSKVHSCSRGTQCIVTLDAVLNVSEVAIRIVKWQASCGVAGSAVAFDRTYFPEPSPGLSTSFNLDVAGVAGVWNLCLCQSSPCAAPSHFNHHVGALLISGLQGFDTVQCHIQRPCMIEIQGSGLETRDRFSITKDNCSGAIESRVPDSFAGLISWANYSLGFTNASVHLNLSTGRWQLCYLLAAWNVSEPGLAGTVEVLGPLPIAQDQQCVVGVNCTLGPLHGLGLSIGDHIVGLPMDKTCGVDSWDSERLHQQPWNLDTSNEVFLTSSALPFGGQWKLCFCSHATICREPVHFPTVLGILSVLGPSATTDFSCEIRQVCSLGLSNGHGLSSADHIALSAGACNQIIGTNFVKKQVVQSQVDLSPSSSHLSIGGQWSVCLCVAEAFPSCSLGDHFTAYVGTLTVVGPLAQSIQCTFGELCVITLHGHGLTNTNALAFIEPRASCGRQVVALKALEVATHVGIGSHHRPVPNLGRHDIYSLGTPMGGPAGASVARLCWKSWWTDLRSGFDVEVGMFTVFGPKQGQHNECTLGLFCSIEIHGHGIAAESQLWLMLAERPAILTASAQPKALHCTSATQMDLVAFEGLTNPQVTSGGDHSAFFNLGTPVIGVVGRYLLCWSQSAQKNLTATKGDLLAEVGELYINGPQQTKHSCTKGEPCQITLAGSGLRDGNFLWLSDAECGNTNRAAGANATNQTTSISTILHLSGLTNPVIQSGPASVFDFGIILEGIPGSRYHLCWSYNDSDASQGLVDAGTFHLTGPEDGQSLFCTLGRPCKPQLSGEGGNPSIEKEVWLVSSKRQRIPNHMLYLGTCDVFVWWKYGFDPSTTWQLIPSTEPGEVWIVSSAVQACSGQMMYLLPNCSLGIKLFTTNLTATWKLVPAPYVPPELQEYWLVSTTSQSCPDHMILFQEHGVWVQSFWHDPRALWQLPRYSATPWPHQSSLLLVSQSSDECPSQDSSTQIPGLSNPTRCCDRVGETQALVLQLSLGIAVASPGIYRMCWGFSPDACWGSGVCQNQAEVKHVVRAGTLTLEGPDMFTTTQFCSLGVQCKLSPRGVGLSLLDSVVVHTGKDCDWNLAPVSATSGTSVKRMCLKGGSDNFARMEVTGGLRVVITTGCADIAASHSGILLHRRYAVPVVPLIFPTWAALSLAGSNAASWRIGVALNGVEIRSFGSEKSVRLLDASYSGACGIFSDSHGRSYYLGAPGFPWHCISREDDSHLECHPEPNGVLCPQVTHWSSVATAAMNLSNSGHPPLLAFMMDGVPLFAPLNVTVNDFDACGGHDSDLPWYHYHANPRSLSIKCIRGDISASRGFTLVTQPNASPDAVKVDLSVVLPVWEMGNKDSLLQNALSAHRWLLTEINSNSTAAEVHLESFLAPGDFTLCWGRHPDLSGHVVPLGQLRVLGPIPVIFRCTLSRTCHLQLQGIGLATENVVFLGVAGNCSAANGSAPVTGLRSPAEVLAPESSKYNLGELSGGNVHGDYVVCWAASASPDTINTFLEVGSLDLDGPLNPHEHYTCALGRKCLLRLRQQGIAGTWGVVPVMELSIRKSGDECNSPVISWSGIVNPMRVKDDGLDNSFAFGDMPTRPLQGDNIFALCWSHQPQKTGWGTAVFVGNLTIYGPSAVSAGENSQAGDPLVLQVSGISLLADDRIRMVTSSVSCGGSGANEFAKHLSGPLVLDAPGAITHQADNARILSWESVVAARAGEYHVCYCTVWSTDNVIPRCTTAQDFNVNAGIISLRGPVALSDGVTISNNIAVQAGVAFNLELRGAALESTDQVRLVLRGPQMVCGAPGSDINAVSVLGGLANSDGPVVPGSTGDASTSRMWLSNMIIKAGLYGLCWCGFNCSYAENFRVDVGSVNALGPQSFVDSSREPLAPFAGISFGLQLHGLGLLDNDYVKIVPAASVGGCAEANSDSAFQGALSNGPEVSGGVGSTGDLATSQRWDLHMLVPQTYRVCWCGGKSGSTSIQCGLTGIGRQRRWVDIDTFEAYGPTSAVNGISLQPLAPVAGRTFVLELRGRRIPEQLKLALVVHSQLCGSGEHPPDQVLPRRPGLSYVGSTGRRQTSQRWPVAWARSAGAFRLCACLRSSSCVRMKDFDVDVGALGVGGPQPLYPGQLQITAGIPFTLEVAGSRLDVMDQVRIVSANRNCNAEINQHTTLLRGPLADDPTLSGIDVKNGTSLLWPGVALVLGGSYRICWCGGQRNCTLEGGFRADAGIFQVLGPAGGETAVCARNGRCQVKINGHGLSAKDHVMLAPRSCLAEVAPPHPPHPNQPHKSPLWRAAVLTEDSTGLVAVWDVLDMAVGTHRICWMSSQGVGVYLPLKTSTTTTGMYATPSIALKQLQQRNNSIDINNSNSSNMSSAFDFFNVSVNTRWAQENLTNRTVLQLGADENINVSHGEQIWIDAGKVVVAGPVGGEERRCVSGQFCHVLGLRGILEAGDQLVAQDGDCASNAIPYWSFFKGSTNASASVRVDFPSPIHTRFVRIYPTKWHDHIALRAGLQVAVCDTCSSTTAIDVKDGLRSASSTMSGATPAQCFSCGQLSSSYGWVAATSAVGEWYEIDSGRVQSITGVILRGQGDADRWVEEFRIMYSSDRLVWHRLLRERESAFGFSDSAVTVATHGGSEAAVSLTIQSTTQFSWPGPIRAHGSSYTLCWCPSFADCSDSASFVTDAGTLHIDGPVGNQIWHCFTGRSCVIEGVRGSGLQSDDVLTVLENCEGKDALDLGDNTSHAIILENFFLRSDKPSEVLEPKGEGRWEHDTLPLKPGRWRICWCRPFRWNSTILNVTDRVPPGKLFDKMPGGAGCLARDVLANAGQLIVSGPQPALFKCTLGQPCIIEPLLGEGLKDGDHVRVSRHNCENTLEPVLGMPGNMDISLGADNGGQRYSWGPEPVLALSGTYVLCWCPGNCSQLEQFTTPAGLLRLAGPHTDQTRTCVSGLVCNLNNITGVEQSFKGEEIMVRANCSQSHSNNTFGFPGAAKIVSDGTTGIKRLGPAYEHITAARFSWYLSNGSFLPISANGGDYRMCWRTGKAPFIYDIGRLSVLGVFGRHKRTVTSSTAMDVNDILGPGTSTGDRMMIKPKCNETTVTSGVPQNGISNKRAQYPSYSWGTRGLEVQGGTYRLCWCVGTYESGGARTCKDPDNFYVDAGELVVNGPEGGQHWTCSSTLPCVVRGVLGIGLSSDDRLMVKDKSCHGGEAVGGLHWVSNAPNLEGTDYVWGLYPVEAIAGTYRLCWCSGISWEAKPCTAQNPERFMVDAGSIDIHGPKSTHASWIRQLGHDLGEQTTGVAIDTTDPTFGLDGVVLAGWTDGTFESNTTARAWGEDQGLRWNAGMMDSDYVTVTCSYMRWAKAAIVYKRTCTYPRLTKQPLSFQSHGGRDGWVTKVAYNGTKLWTRQIGTAGEDVISAVAVGQRREIVVAGHTSSVMLPGVPFDVGVGENEARNGLLDVWIMKLDHNGEYMNACQFGSRADDMSTAVAVDRHENIYLTITKSDLLLGLPFQGGIDGVLVKFNGELLYQWASNIVSSASPSGQDDFPTVITFVEGENDVQNPIVGGYTSGDMLTRNAGGWDIFVMVYSGTATTGARIRSTQLGSTKDEYLRAVTTDSFGNVFVVGSTEGDIDFGPGITLDKKPGKWDAFVIKLDARLKWQWTRMLGTKHNDYGFGLFTVAGGRVGMDDLLLAGTTYAKEWPEGVGGANGTASNGEQSREDLFVIQLHGDGEAAWGKRWRAEGHMRAVGMAGQYEGHAFVAGWVNGAIYPEQSSAPLTAFGMDDAFVMKLTWGRRTATTCYRGADCEVTLLEDQHFEVTDEAFISTIRCGRGSVAAPGIPAPFHALPRPDRRSFRWGNLQTATVITAPVGRYVLCWCRGKCDAVEETAVTSTEAAVIHIAGPDSKQQRTCFSGQRCNTTGLIGDSLSVWDRVVVLDTCGISNAVAGFPNQGITEGIVSFRSLDGVPDADCSAVDTGEVADVPSNWGCRRVTARGGSYRMCWCTTFAGRCDDLTDFRMDTGGLTVVGPLLEQHRQCVQHKRCHIVQVQGVGLQNNDKMIILDKCGMAQTAGIGGSVNSGVFGFPNNGIAVASDAGASFSFNTDVSATGGYYKMCWCSQNSNIAGHACDHVEDFGLTVGSLRLAAPTLGQLRRCIRGEPCAFDAFEGSALEDHDVLYVLTSCPELITVLTPKELVSNAIPGWPRLGRSLPASDSGRGFSWGPEGVSAGVGRYKLCWCILLLGEDLPRCDVTTGEMILAGPVQGQSFRTVAGHVGSVTSLHGYGFVEKNDSLIAAKSCESREPVPGFPQSGRAAVVGLVSHESTPSLGLADFSWGSKPVVHPGGIVQLCWFTEKKNSDTSVPIHAGMLYVDGPYSSQNFNCYSGKPCVVKQLLGEGLAAGDFLLVGKGNCVGGIAPVSDFGGIAVSYPSPDGTEFRWPGRPFASGGRYTLCWCRVSKIASGPSCKFSNEFLVEAGDLTLEGPVVGQKHHCQSSSLCTLQLKWSSSISSVLGSVWLSKQACGVAKSAAQEFTPRTVASGSSHVTWDPLSINGGDWSLCWCHLPGCDGPEDFVYQIGVLQVAGPYAKQSFICTVHQSCTIGPVHGLHLKDGHKLLVRGHSLCHDDPVNSTFSLSFAGNTSSPSAAPQQQPLNSSSRNGTPQHELRNSSSPTAAPQQQLNLPNLTNLTNFPNLTNLPNPPTGAPQQKLSNGFPREGLSLGATHCGEHFVGCTVSWGPEAVTAPIGTYTLCWCHSPGCEVDAYVVKAGNLQIVPPEVV